MKRYYFHLEMCGVSYPDGEGRELPGLQDARRMAELDARELLSADVKAGRLCLDCLINIADEDGNVLLTVPFHETVELSGRLVYA